MNAVDELAHQIETRQWALDRFIEESGWESALRFPLQADASFRRYIRLKKGKETRMLMDAPPPTEDVKPFVKIATHLNQLGFSAPKILAQDLDRGFLMLEDFGDATFTQLLNQGMGESVLYEAAVDALAKLHEHSNNAEVDIPSYDSQALLDEVDLFIDWYWPEVMGAPITDTKRDEFHLAWEAIFEQQPALSPCIVLRDFHVDNIMLLPNRTNPENCGLLDFQDALIGSPAYDVTSLLEDARRDISDEFRLSMLERYFDARPSLDPEEFMLSYRILSAQRHMKIVGIFTRLARRDGKQHYLKHMNRVMKYLHQHLQHPIFLPLETWLKRNMPQYETIPYALSVI